MNSKLFLIVALTAFLIGGCNQTSQKYTVINDTDANGYTYETVKGDPLKARIYTLDNGLKVYLTQNTDKPRIMTMIPVRVGAKNDPRETTGLAHYFEHIMFKGTDDLGTTDWEQEKVLIAQISDLFEAHKAATDPTEKARIYQQIDSLSYVASKFATANEYAKTISYMGGKGTNAWTSYEQTVYINDIPSNDLERWLKLESERFNDVVLRLFHTELEIVYEEFNMGQDNDYRVAYNAIFENLFSTHPYRVSVIGLAEHLKNPSMVNILNFKKDYYVSNNMAICLSGDIDFEKTIQLIDKYWGFMEPNPNIPEFTFEPEPEITEITEVDVYGPDQEFLNIAFRTPGKKDKNSKYFKIIDMLLSNSKAGLIDLDLVKSQKVLRAYSNYNAMNDYGFFLLSGYARNGQTLEEVKELLMAELEKIKKGEFEDWLTVAVINDLKLRKIRMQEGNYAVYDFIGAFLSNTPWVEVVEELDELEKITKEELVKFANEFFKENYVVIYKRNGENKNKIYVEKPKITPIEVNRDSESEFLTELKKMEIQDLEPVFLDFEKDLIHENLSEGVEFFYAKNPSNQIAYAYYLVEMGKLQDKKIPLAVDYLKYIGTDKYTIEELSKQFYKLGLTFRVGTNDELAYVFVSGLDENLGEGLNLMEQILSNSKADQDAYDKFVDGIIKKRENNKLSKNQILWQGLGNYAKYGAVSPFTDIISEEDLRAIDPNELTQIIQGLFGYEHSVFYYGPKSKEQAKEVVAQTHKAGENLKAVLVAKEYPELDVLEPTVYFCNYDMVQTQILLISKDEVFDADKLPIIKLFNQYFGGSMSSVIFQEMREAKGLAYSAFASYSTPIKEGKSNYKYAFIATQPDKMALALSTFMDLLNNMPESEMAFNTSKDAIINKLNSERIIKDGVFWTYLRNKNLGIETDYRADIYKQVNEFTMDDLLVFFNKYIKDSKFNILVLGDRNKIDFEELKKYGEVKELELEEIFNY